LEFLLAEAPWLVAAQQELAAVPGAKQPLRIAEPVQELLSPQEQAAPLAADAVPPVA